MEKTIPGIHHLTAIASDPQRNSSRLRLTRQALPPTRHPISWAHI